MTLFILAKQEHNNESGIQFRDEIWPSLAQFNHWIPTCTATFNCKHILA